MAASPVSHEDSEAATPGHGSGRERGFGEPATVGDRSPEPRTAGAKPPRTEYAATPMARELYESLLTLTGWADRHSRTIAAARLAYDDRATRSDGPPGAA
ncbi:hypothetical protein [Nocardia sp. NPDC003963]